MYSFASCRAEAKNASDSFVSCQINNIIKKEKRREKMLMRYDSYYPVHKPIVRFGVSEFWICKFRRSPFNLHNFN